MKKTIIVISLLLLAGWSIRAQERVVEMDTNSAFMEKVNGQWRIRTALRTKEIKDAEKAAIEAINQFQDAVTYLWAPKPIEETFTDYKTRKTDRINETLKLFLGEGKSYFVNVGEAKYRVHWSSDMNSYYYTNFMGKIYKIKKSQTISEDNRRYFISNGEVEMPPVQIEVTSRNRGSRVYPVEDYLKNIAQLKDGTYVKYDNVQIECGGFVVSNGLKRGNDGCFHGTIRYWQKFSGYRGEVMRYSDITYREIEIVVCIVYQGDELVMDVRLGDIKALSTK